MKLLYDSIRLLEYNLFGSCAVRNDRIIEAFRKDPSNVFLVSFPRTGSHWLRELMELYFGSPILPRIFFHPLANEFIAQHTHDKSLELDWPNVIYLYRTPVDTVYSELRYEGLWPPREWAVRAVGRAYGRHLEKWLLNATFVRRRCDVRYRDLSERPEDVFARLSDFFGAEFDRGRVQDAVVKVDKDRVKSDTKHDDTVVRTDSQYERDRETFRDQYGPAVREAVRGVDPRLAAVWEPSE